MFPSPDLTVEDATVNNITGMSLKLQHLDALNNQRQLDLQVEANKSKDNFIVSCLSGYYSSAQFPDKAIEGVPR